MKKSLRNKIVYPLIASGIGMVLAAALGEVAVRQFGLSKTWESYKDVEKNKRQVHTTRQLGFTRVPNSSFRGARDALFVINHLGFRDDSLPRESTKRRIAFMGDSVTEGFGVEEELRFSSVFKQSLAKRSGDFEVLNFGVTGHATCDAIQVLKKYVAGFSPEVVVLQVCINDFDRNMYEIIHHGPDSSEIGRDEAQAAKTAASRAKPGGIKQFFQKNSVLYLFLAERYNYLKLRNSIPNDLSPTHDFMKPEYWDKTFGYLVEMDSICRERGIRLFVTYVPLEVEVLIKDDETGTIVNNRIADFCKSSGIRFIDVGQSLRESESGYSLYLDDCHLTPKGNRVVAGSLLDHLSHELNLR